MTIIRSSLPYTVYPAGHTVQRYNNGVMDQRQDSEGMTSPKVDAS